MLGIIHQAKRILSVAIYSASRLLFGQLWSHTKNLSDGIVIQRMDDFRKRSWRHHVQIGLRHYADHCSGPLRR